MGTNRPDIIINPVNGTSVPSTGYTYFRDAREWGSGLVGASDGSPTLEQAVADCIAQGYRRLFIPRGCKITRPLILAQLYQGNYIGFNLEIFGDGEMWDTSPTPHILAQFADTFAIGIQHGKHIVKVSAIGRVWSFTDGVCRDSRYSPYSGIVIDPFSNGQVPSDGGYPGLTSKYIGNGNQAGSTSTFISNVLLDNFVVGTCNSPNGWTRNGENTEIENIQFRFNKLCISGGQDQEKNNRIKNFACWYNSHTIFANGGVYGADGAGDWVIDGGNIAGRVNTFISSNASGWFPVTIKNVYAESLGKWGMISNTNTTMAKVENCKIDFATPNEAGFQSPLISGQGNVVYDGCTFRYYGMPGMPIPITGNILFTNCNFSGFPLLGGGYFYPRFLNCVSDRAALGLTGIKVFGGGEYVVPYGDWTLQLVSDATALTNYNNGTTVFHDEINSKSQDIYTTLTADVTTLSISGNTGTFTSSNPSVYYQNCLLKIGTAPYYSAAFNAVVTAISGSTISVAYFPSAATSGTYSIVSYHPVVFNGSFIGDITNGQNTILNCRAGQWNNDLTSYVGKVIRNPFGGSKYIKIISVLGTTITFYGTVVTTKTGVVFGNYTSEEIYIDNASTNAFPAGYIVRRGDKIITQKGSENSIEYIITKGGFLSGDTDARQATPQIAY